MPLVFIHGVNTRKTDADYSRAVAARRTMFDQLVAREVRKTYPRFHVAEDIYWGDLGVGFLWNLRSVPDIRTKETQGPEEDALRNPDLLRIVSDETSGAKVEHLGPPQPLVEAANRDPAGLVRAMFAEEAGRFAPPSIRPPDKSASADKTAEAQGQHLGLLLIAVERFARQAAEQPALVQDTNDDDVTRKIQDGIRKQYQQVYDEARKEAETAAAGVEHLGVLADGIGWTLDHLKQTVSGSAAYARNAAMAAARGASLGLSKWFRDPVSRKGLRFLGDVLVYLHHGRTALPSIYERVREGLLALKPKDGEPLVVVTHSFGSEILYDLLTSGGLDGLTIDLWVTVGAQTSLFAEMRLFAAMPPDIPKDTQSYALGRPSSVTKWVNVYDPADPLSYKHQPVFGDVTDIPVSEGGNLTNAHGHYFVTISFYETVLQQLRSGMEQATARGSSEP